MNRPQFNWFGWFMVALAVSAVAALALSGCSGAEFTAEKDAKWLIGTGGSEVQVGITGGQRSVSSLAGASSTGGTAGSFSSSVRLETGGSSLLLDSAVTTGGSGDNSTGGANSTGGLSGSGGSSVMLATGGELATGGSSVAVDRPCDGLCSNPTVFSVPVAGAFSSPLLGTGQSCWETVSALIGGVQSNFAVDRRLYVNGALAIPSQWSLPVSVHGGYCVLVKPGDTDLATFTVW